MPELFKVPIVVMQDEEEIDGFTFEIHLIGEYNDILTIALLMDDEILDIYAGPSDEIWTAIENIIERFDIE